MFIFIYTIQEAKFADASANQIKRSCREGQSYDEKIIPSFSKVCFVQTRSEV